MPEPGREGKKQFERESSVEMLKSKVFIKKTRKGSIVKVVREHYLRDDIGCGSEQCETCQNNKAVLERNPPSFSTLCKFPHYIMPDTNVVLHQVSNSQENSRRTHRILI